MHHLSPGMQRCIEECLRCHSMCLGMAMNHCLEQGGRHVEPQHFRLMIACAEICQASANMMLTGSDYHKATCSVCADVCEACAQSCESLEGMEDCVSVCRSCASMCREMAAS